MVGLVGSVVGFASGGLDASFAGVGGLAFFWLAAWASSRCRSASSGVGKRRERLTSLRVVPPRYSTQSAPFFRPWIARTVPLSTPLG